jgi:hypothetical protein
MATAPARNCCIGDARLRQTGELAGAGRAPAAILHGVVEGEVDDLQEPAPFGAVCHLSSSYFMSCDLTSAAKTG